MEVRELKCKKQSYVNFTLLNSNQFAEVLSHLHDDQTDKSEMGYFWVKNRLAYNLIKTGFKCTIRIEITKLNKVQF